VSGPGVSGQGGGPQANCPSCGASIGFRWAGAVQTTCGYCHSILLRHDLDLTQVGEVSQPPPATSPVQLGTEGFYEGRPFTVVGRIAYRYGRGHWSEWHIVFSDGASGWLSDAQEEYAVTFAAEEPAHLPSAREVRPGKSVFYATTEYVVTTLTTAQYAGVEGELPFEYWDKEEVLFVDMRSEGGDFATLDYSEEEPLLFTGEHVAFEGLRLTGTREVEPEAVQDVKTLGCPNCGGSVTIRAAGVALNVVCESCGSVLDAASPGLDILQKFEEHRRIEPDIPLGSVGRFKGADYTALGFQIRTITVEGLDYSWREYLLFSPEHGYRYLSEYDGHWNFITTVKSLPKRISGGHPKAVLHGETFKHFQTATARTTYVLGEFPWQIRVGDRAVCADYVLPPRLLSSEATDEEVTWSLGEYKTGKEIWQAFGLSGQPPRATGVFANQPSPHANTASRAWGTFGLLAALLAALLVVRMALPNSRFVDRETYVYDPARPDSAVVVMGPFTVDGRPSNLEVSTVADVSNNWLYLNFSLLNVDTGDATDFGREVSYYFGVDGGERWSEGDQDDRALVPRIPPGEYVLRIVPEGSARANYAVQVRRDVPARAFYALALLAILAPAILVTLRSAGFETKRWAESDHAPED